MLTDDELRKLRDRATPGPWAVSGVRMRIQKAEFHQIISYDAAAKTDIQIALAGFDPRTGVGLIDARLIAAAPDLAAEVLRLRAALAFYSCKDGCNDCSENERDLIGCGWTARAALAAIADEATP